MFRSSDFRSSKFRFYSMLTTQIPMKTWKCRCRTFSLSINKVVISFSNFLFKNAFVILIKFTVLGKCFIRF